MFDETDQLHNLLWKLGEASTEDLQNIIYFIEHDRCRPQAKLSQIYEELVNSVNGLQAVSRKTVLITASLLFKVLEPKKNKRGQGSSGYIEVKYFKRGSVNRRYYGPYLYLRYWVSSGGYDKTERKLVSKYIGRKTLAKALEDGYISQERILSAYYDGRLNELEQELENELLERGSE